MKFTYNCVHGERPPFTFRFALNFLDFGFWILHADVVKYLSCLLVEQPNALPVEFNFFVVDLVKD